jgi:predicted RNase H-like HicB family nuclease
MTYTVIVEKSASNYSAYVHELPGCVAVGDTLEELKRSVTEAIIFHLATMLEEGMELPNLDSLTNLVQLESIVELVEA